MLVTDVYYPEEASPLVEDTKKPRRKGVIMTVKGPFGKTEAKNKNDRIYTNALWDSILSKPDIQDRLKERAVFGEADHPQTLFPALTRISHIVTALSLDKQSNQIMGEADVLDTPSGRIIKTIYDAGGKIGISSRGAGGLRTEGNKQIVDEKQYRFGGFDFVVEPSMDNAYPKRIQESVAGILTESIDEVEKDVDYYQQILERICPDGNVRLESVDGQLCVLHEGQNLMESEAPTEAPTNPSDTFREAEGVTQEANTFRSKEKFLLKRLQEMREAYADLRKRMAQNPITEQAVTESVEEGEIQQPQETPSDSLQAIQLEQHRGEIEALRLEIQEAETVISDLQRQVIEQDKVIREERRRSKAAETPATIEESTEYKTLVEQVADYQSKLESSEMENNVTEKRVQSLQESNKRLKAQVAQDQGKMEELQEALMELEQENLALYIEYKASDLALDSSKLVDALPSNPSREDVDKVASLMVESRTKQTFGEDLPLFGESNKAPGQAGQKVIVESRSPKSGTKSRISGMIGKLK